MLETMLGIAGIDMSSEAKSAMVIPDSNRKIPS
jgi:hypothetical protein